MNQAVPTAVSLLATVDRAEISAGPWMRLLFDRERFVAYVDELLADGVEAITPTPRGRPPGSPRSAP